MSDVCLVCEQSVRPRQEGLQCERCEGWQHRVCDTGITREAYWLAVKERRNIDWTCNQCNGLINNTSNAPDNTSQTGTDIRSFTLHNPLVESEHNTAVNSTQNNANSFVVPQQLDESSILDPAPSTSGTNETANTIPSFSIIPATSLRKQDKLYDDLGYSYTKKRENKNSVIWRCSVRNRAIGVCPATVKQCGAIFTKAARDHIHSAKDGCSTAAINARDVKIKAKENVSRPASNIVEEMDSNRQQLFHGLPVPNTFQSGLQSTGNPPQKFINETIPSQSTGGFQPVKLLNEEEIKHSNGNDQGDEDETLENSSMIDVDNGPQVGEALGVTLVGDQSHLADLPDINHSSVQSNPHKVFIDESTPSENLRQPVDNFTNGKVKLGTNAALSHLVDCFVSSTCLQPICGKTGIITNSEFVGSDGQFEDGVQYKRERSLGKGSFGSVTLNRLVFSQKLFVEKEIFGNFNRREVDIIASLQHVNIIQFCGFVLKDNNLPQILLEYAGVNLHEYVQKTKVIADEEIRGLTKQGLCAIEYLDQHEIFNPDIKPENFCIQDGVLKMIDFGSCKTAQDGFQFDGGWTVEYMAPEACMLFLKSKISLPQNVINLYGNCQLSKKYHVYALALTAMYMKKREHVMVHFATGGQGYEKFDVQKIKKIKFEILAFVAEKPNFVKTKTTVEENWIPSMRGLLNVMLEGLPEKRPDAHEILNELTKIEQEQKAVLKPPPIISPGEIVKQRLKHRLKHRLSAKEAHPYIKPQEKPKHGEKMPIEESSSMVTQEMLVSDEQRVQPQNIPNLAMLF